MVRNIHREMAEIEKLHSLLIDTAWRPQRINCPG
jgi:hypothetical protein